MNDVNNDWYYEEPEDENYEEREARERAEEAAWNEYHDSDDYE